MHLTANAQPALASLELAISNLQAAIAEFGPRLDNRQAIIDLATVVSGRAEALGDVFAGDVQERDRDIANQCFVANLHISARAMRHTALQLDIDLPGSAYPIRMYQHAVESFVQAALDLRDVDERKPLVALVDEITQALDGIIAMGEISSSVQPVKDARKSIAIMRSSLMEPIPMAQPDEVYVGKPRDRQREILNEDLHELRDRIAGIRASRVRGGLTEVSAIRAKAEGLRQAVTADPHSAITADEIVQHTTSLDEIERDIRALARLACLETSQEHFLTPDLPRPLQQVEAVRQLLGKQTSPTSPKPSSLLSGIKAAFTWGDEPEAA